MASARGAAGRLNRAKAVRQHPQQHSVLHYEPAKLVNHVEQREVLVCRTPGCKCDAATAERATPPKVKTRAGASLLALLLEGSELALRVRLSPEPYRPMHDGADA